MNAIVSVLGADRPGIIAMVSGALYEFGVNILDINQTVMRDSIFAMTMVIDISAMERTFDELKTRLEKTAAKLNVEIKLQREEIFKSMHTV